MDALLLSVVAKQVAARSVGARVMRVDQPSVSEVILSLRKSGLNMYLLVSIDARNARLHFTDNPRRTGDHPPAFCMLLRRRLEGSRIERVYQPEMERVVHIDVLSSNEIGDAQKLSLVIEIMAKRSNLILCDSDLGIAGVMRPVHASHNRYRQLLPGMAYEPPPPPGKTPPTCVTKDTFGNAVTDCERAVLSCVRGFGPLLAREVCQRSRHLETLYCPAEALSMATRDIWRESQQQAAHIYFDASGKPLEVHVVELGIQHTSRETFCDVSEALDRFYSELKSIEDVQTQAHSVRQVLGTCIQRIRRRLEVRSKEISKSLERDALKHKADLILTYLPEVRSVLAAGGRSVELLDPAEGTAIRVELDPRKSASENAQSYYRRYSKERARYEALLPQVQSDQADLAYLEGVLESLEFACSVQHIEDVRSELTQQGFYKPRETRTRSKPSRTGQSTPYFQAIRTSLGDEVLFGTNNKQNDYLTNRVAKPDDLWFHAKDVPGAHVILRNRGDVQQQSIKEAAAIAAAYSKARHSTKVLVDYTHVKHVRKPPGSRPGMVIYDHHRTIAVDPTDARTAKPQ